MRINAVTERDANLPPLADEFAEDFSGMALASLFDLFSGYDQLPLDKDSRDLTTFHTPLGLLRQTTLPQGCTNLVAICQRILKKVLADKIPNIGDVFLDDIGVKGPKSTYSNAEILPGIWQFVFEHFQNVDQVLYSLELAGLTISAVKSQIAVPGIVIVGYYCDIEGRHPLTSKVIKILEWPAPMNITEVRAFVGVCVYYRIWISWFAVIAGPLYYLLRRGVVFAWTDKQQKAMDTLKIALTSAPALITIVYLDGAGDIIVAVDASGRGYGAALMQIFMATKKRQVARYESGIWSEVESRYDAGKLECLAVLKLLKKFRSYLYGVHFILEMDAKTLVAQLNRTATDLPGLVVVRWIAWIRLFDFTVRHVPGDKNMVADGLSRRPPTAREYRELEQEEDIDDFLDAEFNSCYLASPMEGDFELEPVLNPEVSWSEESLQIARYLRSLEKPEGMSSS